MGTCEGFLSVWKLRLKPQICVWCLFCIPGRLMLDSRIVLQLKAASGQTRDLQRNGWLCFQRGRGAGQEPCKQAGVWFPDGLSEGAGLLGVLLEGLLGVQLFFCFQTLALCAKVDNSVSAVLSRPEISQHEAQAPPAMNLHLCVTQHCTFPARAPCEGQQRLAVEVNRHQDISALFAFLVLGWHYSSSDFNNVTMSNLHCLPFKSICV